MYIIYVVFLLISLVLVQYTKASTEEGPYIELARQPVIVGKKQRIFICHECDGENGLINNFSKNIEKHLKDSVETIMDQPHLNLGDEVTKFCNLIKTVDFVVLITSPTLPQKTTETKSWIGEEIKIIQERLQYDSSFLIPIALVESENKIKDTFPSPLKDYAPQDNKQNSAEILNYYTNIQKIRPELPYPKEEWFTELIGKIKGKVERSRIRTKISFYLSDVPKSSNNSEDKEITKADLKLESAINLSLYSAAAFAFFNLLIEHVILVNHGFTISQSRCDDDTFHDLDWFAACGPAVLSFISVTALIWDKTQDYSKSLVVGLLMGVAIEVLTTFILREVNACTNGSFYWTTSGISLILGGLSGYLTRQSLDNNRLKWIAEPYLDLEISKVRETPCGEDIIYSLKSSFRPILGWKNEQDKNNTYNSFIKLNLFTPLEEIKSESTQYHYIKINLINEHENLKQKVIYTSLLDETIEIGTLVNLICLTSSKFSQCSWGMLDTELNESSRLTQNNNRITPALFTCKIFEELITTRIKNNKQTKSFINGLIKKLNTTDNDIRLTIKRYFQSQKNQSTYENNINFENLERLVSELENKKELKHLLPINIDCS